MMCFFILPPPDLLTKVNDFNLLALIVLQH